MMSVCVSLDNAILTKRKWLLIMFYVHNIKFFLFTNQSLTNTSHVQSPVIDAQSSASFSFQQYLLNITAWLETG